MRAGVIVAKRTRDTLTASRVRPRAATATRADDAMAAARQQRQHARRIGAIERLAEDARAERDRRVGAEDRRRREPARAQAPARGAQLGARHALDIGRGRLAGARRFERFDVLVGVGEQQLVANADLVEQLAPARALRREVDEAGAAGTRVGAHSR